ncbi:MAG: hypothetical protein IKH57_19200 [Clostridia bacterium]|nr:hypothetical protein [Clostridia bacterium]
MQKKIAALSALILTVGLAYTVFHFPFSAVSAPPARLALTRVWVSEQEPALWAWLRKEAKKYEKETGTRVYLRAVPAEMKTGGSDALPPDVWISSAGESVLALEGYALFYRNDEAGIITPVPTSLLFYRPTPSPGPTAAPAPTADIAQFSAILAPQNVPAAVSGIIRSAHPAADFADGKGDAAILTAGQAESLPFRVSALPLPGRSGFIAIRGTAATPAGASLLDALLSENAQRQLSEEGLYSPVFQLYQGADPLRAMIENSR